MAAFNLETPSPPRSPSLEWHSTTGGAYDRTIPVLSGYDLDALDNTSSQSQSQHQISVSSPSLSSSHCRATLDFASAYPQTASGHIDPEELQELSRSANEAPWSDSSLRGTRLLQPLPRWPPYRNTLKAHSVAGGATNLLYQRPARFPYQASLIDSAYDSQPHDTTTLASFSTQLEAGEVPDTALGKSASPPKRKEFEAHSSGDNTLSKRKRAKSLINPCSTCGVISKNHSDAKCVHNGPGYRYALTEDRKHHEHHTRPYVCGEPACPRKDGFGTANDLQRHRRCVHGALPDVGNRLGHICRACPSPPFGEHPKRWPRLDNFKAHITRKHKEWNVDDLVANSRVIQPAMPLSDPGYASNQPLSQAGEEEIHFDFFAPLEMPISNHELLQNAMSCMGDSTHLPSLAGVGEGTLSGNCYDDRDLLSAFPGPPYIQGTTDTVDLLGDGSFLQTDSGQPLTKEFGLHHHVDYQSNIHELPSSYGSSHWTDYAMPIMDGNCTYSSQAPSVDPLDALATYRDENGGYRCPHCSKMWKRECDLRKHLKRHEKPYGCTFSRCDRGFGSRYDWRRHERSKHTLKEMWRCELTGDDGNTCGEVYQTEKLFMNHLYKQHQLEPGDSAATRCLQEMAFGVGHFRVWCGFCNIVVTPDKDRPAGGPRGWELHFNHVGDHFDKDKRHVDEWNCIELASRETRRPESDLSTRTGRDNDGFSRHDAPEYSPSIKLKVEDTDLDAEGFTESE